MKQNKLFNKCCDNCDPNTREEVWKQMDKELGREENRGDSSKILSNSPKQTLEQAAEAYAEGLAIKNQYERVVEEMDVIAGFFAGAEWQKKQPITFNCIGKQVTMTVQQLIDYYLDRECADVADECGF